MAFVHTASARHAQARKRVAAKAVDLAQLYREMARKLQRIVDDTAAKLGDRNQAARAIKAIKEAAAGTAGPAEDAVQGLMDAALDAGVDAADADIMAGGGDVLADLSRVNRQAADRAARDVYRDLAGRTKNIESRLTEAIREAGAQAFRDAMLVGSNPGTVARNFLNALAERGANPVKFVDAAGREWQPEKYALMVANTKSAILYNTATVDRLRDADVGIAQVTAGGTEDPLCAPWIGMLIALDAATAKRLKLPKIEDVLGGGPPFHPNCRHSLIARVEGALQAATLATAQARAKKLAPLIGVSNLRRARAIAIGLGF